jgi:CheY-like chemotaxis protein
MTVLIVDDLKVNRDLLFMMLRNENLNFDFAASGTEAIIKVKQNKSIKLVFMDIQMPDMNGFQTTEEIRKFDEEVKIIAVTAYAGTGYDALCKLSGMNAYLPKPFSLQQLTDTLSKYLSRN